MKREKYLLLAGCLLLILIASTSLATTPCEDAFTNVGTQCTTAYPPVLNYIKNYIPELYTGPYVMWWVQRLLNPAQDWEVASNKFFDSLPGAAQPEGTIFEKNVQVPMSDGLKLACNVFRPDKPGKFPVMMNFTPFSKDAYLQHDDFGASQLTGFESINPGLWVQNDYAVVLCDNRGNGRSPGAPATGNDANYDIYDGIEWAGTQPWSNGKVGMFGHSALCSSQLNAAGMVDVNGNPNAPPHLKAILPWGCTTDVRDQRYPGGIPETHFLSSRGPNKPLWQVGQTFPPRPALPARKLENIKIPALVSCDWADKKQHLRGTLRTWRTMSTPPKYKWLYMHSLRKWQGLYTPIEHRRIQLMFADQFLKGENSGMTEFPHVRVARQVKLLDWSVRHDEDWPIPGTKYTKLYLGDNATLNSRKPSKAAEVSYDWATGKAIFDITFHEDTEISGHIMAKLWVSPQSATDMDLFLTLRKLDAYGHEINFDSDILPGRLPVDYGWMRLSKRALDPTLSKPWLPEQISVTPNDPLHPAQPVNPGQIVSCEVQLVGSSTMFRAGEKLRLEIAGKMPPDNLFAYENTVNAGLHTIYFGGGYDSYLMVPEVPPTKGQKGHEGYAKHND
jgi:predicted acyl esterase